MPQLEAYGIQSDLQYVTRVVALVKERINFIKELWGQASFFFKAPETYDEKTVKKRWKEDSAQRLSELIGVLQDITDFHSENTENIVKAWIESNGYHLGNIMNAFRLAVVGESKGPHMFDITELLGKEETIRRIQKAINTLS